VDDTEQKRSTRRRTFDVAALAAGASVAKMAEAKLLDRMRDLLWTEHYSIRTRERCVRPCSDPGHETPEPIKLLSASML
jgi:hypothetical protein